MKFRCMMMAGALISAPAFAQDAYVSDPAHTLATFEISHLGFSVTRGRFNKVEVKAQLDRAARKGSVEAVIATASLDTAWEARDKHARSEDYLNVEKFPTMTFKSTNLKFDGDNLAAMDGDLTIMGVTKPVTFTVTQFRCAPHPVNKREMCGADARTQIKRQDFGMTRSSAAVGNDIAIAVSIEAMKQ
jgi:polyisoprenoid-binding protein YceI